MQIDIISDVNCPYCLLGWLQLSRALEDDGLIADIRWHPYEINPHLTDAPLSIAENLAKKYGRTQAEAMIRNETITASAAELGVVLDFPTDLPVYNSRKSHEAIAFATSQGRGHEFAVAALIGVFAERLNPSDTNALANLSASHGIDAAMMGNALDEQLYTVEVDEQIRALTAQGVRGVPTYIFAQKFAASGALGVDGFQQALNKALVDEG